MDPKTTAAMGSITPNYTSGHRQTIAIEEEPIPDAPPSYEASVSPTRSHGAAIFTPATTTRPNTASTSSRSSTHSREPLQCVDREQYSSHQPMRYVYKLDDKTKAALEKSPGCCFSTRGGCCFSDMGGCCCSSNAGCCFSSNAGCCFSDNAGCFFSDNGGAFCSNNGGACCSDPGPGNVHRF
ncbi:hypothetical protein OQA88_1864 [Cercophora sp. LCS_1]